MRVPEQLRGDEKNPGRVERLAGADQPLVTVMVRHVVRREQDRVVACGVQAAVGAVNDSRLGEDDAALGLERVDDELVVRGTVRRRCALRGGQRHGGAEQQENEERRARHW